MKYEWKKSEKEIYNVKTKPIIVNIPKANFICIDGVGNPNSLQFQE